MNKRSSLLGVILILIGISAILKNFRIMPGNSFILFGGIFLLYLWYLKRQQVFLVLGSLALFSGVLSILQDLRIFQFKMSGEMVLLALGVLFIFFYYQKGIFGFIFPGAILISLAGYVFLMNNFNSAKLWPSYFILLGFAFYLIYFTAFYGRSSWPLVVGTILNLLGIVFLAFSYGLLNWRLYQYYNYVWPIILILFGVLLLMRVFSEKIH